MFDVWLTRFIGFLVVMLLGLSLSFSEKFSSIEHHLNIIEVKIEKIDNKLDNMDHRIIVLEKK